MSLWLFCDTGVAIVRENAANLRRLTLKREPTSFLNLVKNLGLVTCGLMVTGIAILMLLARGKGEDITGIVAPALLVTFVAGIASGIAAILQKRAQ